MKKIFYGFITLILLGVALNIILAISACSSIVASDKTELNVDKIISSDLEYMALNYGEDYRWYGLNMLLKEYLDESDEGSVVEAINTFMILSDPKKSYDTNILRIKHTLKDDTVEIIPSLWVEEDVSMNKSDIKLSFKESYKIASAATPKLHTKRVVLRKQLGPNNANPQFIYGNNHGLLFVDSYYGYSSSEAPSFQGTGFATWLGDWPY